MKAVEDEHKMGIRNISGNDPRLITPAVEGAPATRRPPPKDAPAESSLPADELKRPQAERPPSREDVRRMSQFLSKIVESLNWNIKVRIDETHDRIVTQIVDPEKDEVIKQIPPQELLDIMARVKELVGLLLDREA